MSCSDLKRVRATARVSWSAGTIKPPCKVTSEPWCVDGAGRTTEATHLVSDALLATHANSSILILQDKNSGIHARYASDGSKREQVAHARASAQGSSKLAKQRL